jgi:hypothetical protein
MTHGCSDESQTPLNEMVAKSVTGSGPEGILGPPVGALPARRQPRGNLIERAPH